MNFVHSRSQECAKSELDLFPVPPTQISLEKGHWIDHQPVSSLADGGTITFLSPGGSCPNNPCDQGKSNKSRWYKSWCKRKGMLFFHEDSIMLFLVYQFPLFPFQVGVVNNFLHSLFGQVDVFLKEKQVMQATST